MPHDLRVKAYFRHNEQDYRIQVFEDDQVWVERQYPHAFAGNLQMPVDPDDILRGVETWRLDQIAPLLDRYEQIYSADGETE